MARMHLGLLPLLVVAAVWPAAARAASAPAQSLYLQQAASGVLEGDQLVLRGVSPRVVAFADRPVRRGGSLATRRFVAGWRASFGGDPPNAALEVARAPDDRDVALLELRRPRYDAARRTLTCAVRRLRHVRGRALAGLERRGDGRAVHRFGRATLYIDPGTSTTGLSVQVTVPTGSTVTLQLAGSTFSYDAMGTFLTNVATPYVMSGNGVPSYADGAVDLRAGSMSFDAGPGGGGLTIYVIASVGVPADGSVTGTASVPAGASLTITPLGGQPVQVADGPFTVPVSG